MFHVLRWRLTLKIWICHSRDLSSIQIRFEANILTHYLHVNTAFGLVQVSVDVRGCASVGDSFSACSLVGDDTFCIPMFSVCRRLIRRQLIFLEKLLCAFSPLECNYQTRLFLSTLHLFVAADFGPLVSISASILGVAIFAQAISLRYFTTCGQNRLLDRWSF